MTSTGRLRPLAVKEARALAPLWLAVAATLAFAGITDDRLVVTVAGFTYVLGAVALGAWTMGHEFALRTLSSLLAQPIERQRLYVVKALVLVVMVATLGALAWWGVLRQHAALVVNTAAGTGLPDVPPWTFVGLTSMAALGIAPAVTIDRAASRAPDDRRS
jgi:hypothetical protein